MITLVSADNKEIKLNLQIAKKCETIKNLLEDINEFKKDLIIPIPEIKGKILEKIIEYLNYHENENFENKEEIEKWDKNFCNVSDEILFEIIMGSNYLHCQNLLDLTCKIVADTIRGKSKNEIEKRYNIV